MIDSNDNRDERIKIKAFYIWLDEGCPDGRADAHWDMAAELVAIEDNYRGTLKPIGEPGEPVEPLLATQNAGLTDQGEEEATKPPGLASSLKFEPSCWNGASAEYGRHRTGLKRINLSARIAQTRDLDHGLAAQPTSRTSWQSKKVDAARRHVLTDDAGLQAEALRAQLVE